MSGVYSRRIRSTPYRNAADTWSLIVELLTQGKAGYPKTELMAVAGVAASVMADRAPKDAAIVVTCDGPRTRVYCLYDGDAIEGDDAAEDVLGFDPLRGDWRVSLSCQAEDLAWVQRALAKHSTRITARGPGEGLAANAQQETDEVELVLDQEGFLAS